MVRKVVILDSARQEFRDIKRHVVQEFGDGVWNAVNLEYKQAIERIRNHPAMGSEVEALQDLGIMNVKAILVRQTRVVYEFDDEWVVLHMFIHTRRDFRSHLLRRLLAP